MRRAPDPSIKKHIDKWEMQTTKQGVGLKSLVGLTRWLPCGIPNNSHKQAI